MQTGTVTLPVPSRVEFQSISNNYNLFGIFRSIPAKIEDSADMSFELFFSLNLMSELNHNFSRFFFFFLIRYDCLCLSLKRQRKKKWYSSNKKNWEKKIKKNKMRDWERENALVWWFPAIWNSEKNIEKCERPLK